MKSLLWILGGLVIAVALYAGYADSKAKWRSEGRAEAERDIAAGRLRVKTFGLPPPWAARYSAPAKSELGVEIDAVAGCIVTEELRARADGYNEPMHREIDRRFGAGALNVLAVKAKAEDVPRD